MLHIVCPKKLFETHPHPYSQTLLRIVGQEDAGNYSHQVEGEVRNLESMETIK